MNKEVIAQGLTYLKYTFPSAFSSFTESDIDNMITIWFSNFKENDPKNFKLAIGRLAQKCKWCPSIAEIKQEIAIIENPILELNAEQEWANVLIAIRKYGSYEPKKALESLTPYTAQIVELVGYNRLCMSENINWEKKQFIDLFNSQQNQDKENLSISSKYRTPTENDRLENIIKKEETLKLEENNNG